jgi:hypothetical protein
MTAYPLNSTHSAGGSQILWEDGERVFFRQWRLSDDGSRIGVLVAMSATEDPSQSSLDRLSHEYRLKVKLDGAWAVRPLDPVHEGGWTMLVLEHAGGEPLDRLLSEPMAMEPFLRIAADVPRCDELNGSLCAHGG